jgi:hypothetical protein
MIYTYLPGRAERVPFDPEQVAFGGRCAICGDRRVRSVGVFTPATPELRHAVLVLRSHPLREGPVAALSYALCKRHTREFQGPRQDEVVTAVENRVLGLARKMVASTCN